MSARRRETAEQRRREDLSEEEKKSAEDEDFEEAMKAAASSTQRKLKPPEQQILLNTPETVDDFLRNFLRRAGLNRTLGCFEAEWYGSTQKLLTRETAGTGVFFIPDALTHGQLLQLELDSVHRETDQLRQEVQATAESLARTQRERDFHRLQYQRVAEQKNELVSNFKQLREHLESYKLVLRQLDDKYQTALRQKGLISLQKDRVQKSTDPDPGLDQEKAKEKKESTERAAKSSPKDSEFPACSRLQRPQQAQGKSLKGQNSFRLSGSIRAHELPISCIALHPRKLLLASASDDRSWRLWALPTNEEKVGHMVLSGEGHSDWLSGCSFHPDGSKLATTSGDTTVRLWDFSRGSCVLTLSGHTRPTWGCSFHSCGHFLASCSADRTAKLWDLSSRRCRLTLRCHTAAVSSVCFLPSSNLLLTCSADKTLVLWDARRGVGAATLRGHQHPCNHAAFSFETHLVASCDSGGIINLWDVRKCASPMAAVDAGPLGANQVAFGQSGRLLGVSSSDGVVRLIDTDCCTASSLVGHSSSVQSVTFDHMGETLLSAGSDGLINIWE
ncbi:uncharacterized protein spag16 [Odontesthes bonariensis]|uniref:uncharacterized protein spag16 n=1 Tax=Odontesthes bonariensis TaxID=219752 RepID=UPI003F58CBC7